MDATTPLEKSIDFYALFYNVNAGMVSEGCGMSHTQVTASSEASLYLNYINAPSPPLKMHPAWGISHRPAIFVWDNKCTQGWVHSVLDVR